MRFCGEDDLPWIDSGRGNEVKLLTAKISESLWIVRTRFQPGTAVQTHRHTGQVYAYTMSGSWHYKESEYVNRAGSFLYEPAGSVHTLLVPEDNTKSQTSGSRFMERTSTWTRKETLNR